MDRERGEPGAGQTVAVTEAWTFEHSVVCPVWKEFAWRFWTNVANWALDSDIQSVQLDGPFASGAQGSTITKNAGRIEWRLADVEPGTAATIEIVLPGALGRFRWMFDDLGGNTRITQRLSIEAEQGRTKEMARSLEIGIPAGMQKLCRHGPRSRGSVKSAIRDGNRALSLLKD